MPTLSTPVGIPAGHYQRSPCCPPCQISRPISGTNTNYSLDGVIAVITWQGILAYGLHYEPYFPPKALSSFKASTANAGGVRCYQTFVCFHYGLIANNSGRYSSISHDIYTPHPMDKYTQQHLRGIGTAGFSVRPGYIMPFTHATHGRPDPWPLWGITSLPPEFCLLTRFTDSGIESA